MAVLHRMIHVDGLDFFSLSHTDAADMIEAFLQGGSDRYDYSALPEFMLVPNRVPGLERLRLELQRIDEDCRTADERDGLASQNGRASLATLSRRLREEEG